MGALAAGPSEAATRMAVQARNWRLVQVDSIFVGIVTAAGTFLPVFLVRLGASANDVALLTALPAVTAFLLAIPFGRMLQARHNIVPWYSRLRLVAWLSYAAIAIAVAVLPRPQAITVSLLIWGLASLPSTAALVGFPMVMDGAAGPGGRFDLLGRRWAIAGVSTAVAVAIGGQFLNALPFPVNFEALLFMISLAGFGSYLQSSRLVIPDQARPPDAPRAPVAARLGGLWRTVMANRPFVRFELRALAYIASIGLAMPVLPLFYVQELAATDGWIGIIGATSFAGGVAGYVGARRVARRGAGAMILLPSLFAMAAGPAVLSIVDWLPAVAAIAFVTGVASAGAQLAIFDAFMRTIPKELGVTFSSVDQSVQNLALVVAPSVSGVLVAVAGTREALLVCAAVGFLAVVLFGLGQRAAGREPAEQPAEAATEAV